MGVQNTDSSTIIELNHISVTFREGGRTVGSGVVTKINA